jgi:hypothetical protein
MPDFFRRTGLLPGTAYVVASDAPAATIRQAHILKARFGDLIQICDGVADDVEIQAAIDAVFALNGGDVYFSDGDYYIATGLTNKLGVRLVMSEGTVLLPTANVDVLTVLQGSSVLGGAIDIFNSPVSLTFTSAALLVSGLGGGTANIFEAKTVVKDIFLHGCYSDNIPTDRGKGLWIKSLNGEAIAFLEVNNVKITGFKEGLLLSAAGTGFINANSISNLYLSYQYYPIYVGLSGASIGGNFISAQIQPAVFTPTALWIEGAPNFNTFDLTVADGNILTSANAVTVINGQNNEFFIFCDKSKIFYDAGTHNTWHFRDIDWIKANTPTCMKDFYQIAIPFRDESGAVASDICHRVGAHSILLYNGPTWGSGAVSKAPKLLFDAVNQYGKSLNTFTLNGDCALTFIFAPSFAYNDAVDHVIAEWYAAAIQRIQIRKTAANNLEVYWEWYLPGAGNATASAVVTFVAGDILIITVVKDETNDLLQLWVNGVLVSSVVAAGQVDTNAHPMYINSTHVPDTYAGGDFYFMGLLLGIPSSEGIMNLAIQQANVVGLGLDKVVNYRNYSDLFMDVLAVSATHVRSNEDLSAAIPITFTIDAQPDVPRTLSGHFDSHAQITAYTIVITGVNARGNTVTETKTEADGWDWETNNAFATITSIIMTARTGTGAGDTMDIGITDVLGLSNDITSTSDVYKIKKNAANAIVAAAQVNVTYDTYDMAVIGLAAGDDFTIWYRSNLNIVS